ncbi:hypothetical protein [Streptomyces phytophilus]|uniref:hypothetical protein n=1 Tax=Streptomyces phytophilus TaxID=722715 RepID=UPI0015F0A7C0|nr:hypothetical protein [Streptomyces phytophilus]
MTSYNRVKKPAQAPSRSHFKRLLTQLDWVDAPGDTTVWTDGVAARKITDFAGEAESLDASGLKAYAPVKRVALVACLVHKARMRAGLTVYPPDQPHYITS